MRLFVVLLVLIFFAGCRGAQELKSPCLEDACPPCKDSSECMIGSNPCHENAYCFHRDEPYFFTQETCDLPYDPPDEACVCSGNVCRASD